MPVYGINGYIIQDRITLDNYSIKMNNREMVWEITDSAHSSELTMKDSVTEQYWKLFISNGQVGWEESDVERNDKIVLTDSYDEKQIKLRISDGQLNWYEVFYFNNFLILTSKFNSSSSVKNISKTPEKHYIGEIGTEFLIDCGIDISEVVSSSIKVLKPDGSEVEWNSLFFTYDDEPNFLLHTIEDGDFDMAGVYKIQPYLEFENWSGLGATVHLTINNKYK